MATQEFFRPNQPQVISQTIDGEVVVINLQSGTYYSLTGTAATIWNALERGLGASALPALLESQFTGCATGLEKIVAGFLDELSAEALIVPAEPNGAVTAPSTTASPEKFVLPAFKKLTDMQELLLLDPVHEVDATGWPLARPNPPSDTTP